MDNGTRRVLNENAKCYGLAIQYPMMMECNFFPKNTIFLNEHF